MLTGEDVNGIEPGGVFAHLAQLRDALLSGDAVADHPVRPSGSRTDRDRMVSLRAHVGGLVQDLTNRQERTEDQNTANQSLLSQAQGRGLRRGDHAVPGAADGAAGQPDDAGRRC